MITLLLHLLRLLPFLFGGHRQLALENLALRHQLAVYKRTGNRPRLRITDRLFWVFCDGSGPPIGGRPPVNAQIKVLVMRIAAANPRLTRSGTSHEYMAIS